MNESHKSLIIEFFYTKEKFLMEILVGEIKFVVIET